MSEEVNEEKERAKRIAGLIADLRSRNERRVIGALKRVPHEGSPEMVEALFDLYAQNPSREAIMLLEKTVHNLKDPNCVAPMIGMLEDPQYSEVHAKILSAIWQSGLDVSEHLLVLINQAVDGEFMKAMEVMTIVENQEFEDDQALTAAIKVMDQAVEVKDDKQDLMVSLRQVLLDKLLG